MLNPTETETSEGYSKEARLQQLRKSVDEGLPRSLSWRQAQLDGLLRFLSDHEESMLAALKSDLGRCAAEARLALSTRFGSDPSSWMPPADGSGPLLPSAGASRGANTEG